MMGIMMTEMIMIGVFLLPFFTRQYLVYYDSLILVTISPIALTDKHDP
jgi:hypothetical protein